MAAGEGIQHVDIQDARQLMVFGRGVLLNTVENNAEGSPHKPGTIDERHSDSWASYANAVAVRNAVITNPGQVRTITFSGRYSFGIRDSERPSTGSEAMAMYTVANAGGDISPDIRQYVESGSLSTYGNWYKSLLGGYIRDDEPLAVFGPREHLKRITRIGEFVVPRLKDKIVPVASDDRHRPPNDKSRAKDILSMLSYGIAMRGVERGHIEAIHDADLRVQEFFEPIVERGPKGVIDAVKVLAQNYFDK